MLEVEPHRLSSYVVYRDASMTSEEDREIMRRIQAGDVDALGDANRLWFDHVMKVILPILKWDREAAKEVVQEGIIKLWKNAHKWKDSASPRNWFITMCKRLAFDELRLKARTEQIEEPNQIVDVPPAKDSEMDLDPELVAQQKAELMDRMRADGCTEYDIEVAFAVAYRKGTIEEALQPIADKRGSQVASVVDHWHKRTKKKLIDAGWKQR